MWRAAPDLVFGRFTNFRWGGRHSAMNRRFGRGRLDAFHGLVEVQFDVATKNDLRESRITFPVVRPWETDGMRDRRVRAVPTHELGNELSDSLQLVQFRTTGWAFQPPM